MEPIISYGRHCIDEKDIESVANVLRGDWLTTGPTVELFEGKLANSVNARFAVACSSGTAALHMAAAVAGLGPGNQAIVPSMTFVATANAARFVGAEVTFSDVDCNNGIMTLDLMTDAIERAEQPVKAIFPVHLNGQIADTPGIAKLARQRGIIVIEDACHALGTVYREADGTVDSVGSCKHSDMAVFSFHPVKTIAMGEGSAVTTNDEEIYKKLKAFRAHGISHDPDNFEQKDRAISASGEVNPWYYEMQELGYNYRISDINCALGASQLDKLSTFVAQRRKLAAHYDHLLAPLAPVIKPISKVPQCDAALHLYAVHIDFVELGLERAKVMKELKQQGIGTQVHYLPVHRQPYYTNRYGNHLLPGSDNYYDRVLSLPLFPAMTKKNVEQVVDALGQLIQEN